MAESELDRAVVFPASTTVEIRLPLWETDTPESFRQWIRGEQALEMILFYLNEFLLRFQIACGFNAAAGRISSLSGLELRHLAAKMFSDDTPLTPSYGLIPNLPAYAVRPPEPAPEDSDARLEYMLRVPVVPLWLALAHDANSLLHRRRYEQSLVGWIQALEVAVGQIAPHLGVDLSERKTLEERVSFVLESRGREPLGLGLAARLKNVRQARNKIVHEGLGRRLESSEAHGHADSVIEALALLEQLALDELPPHEESWPDDA